MITNVKSLNLKKGTFIELSVNHGKKKHLIPIVLKKENTNLNIGRPITNHHHHFLCLLPSTNFGTYMPLSLFFHRPIKH